MRSFGLLVVIFFANSALASVDFAKMIEANHNAANQLRKTMKMGKNKVKVHPSLTGDKAKKLLPETVAVAQSKELVFENDRLTFDERIKKLEIGQIK